MATRIVGRWKLGLLVFVLVLAAFFAGFRFGEYSRHVEQTREHQGYEEFWIDKGYDQGWADAAKGISRE